MKRYKILSALEEDIDSSFIWIKDKDIPKPTLAKIISHKNAIWVSLQIADKAFMRQYKAATLECNTPNKEFLIINHWYLYKLGIQSGKEYELSVKPNHNSLLLPIRNLQVAFSSKHNYLCLYIMLIVTSILSMIVGLLLVFVIR